MKYKILVIDDDKPFHIFMKSLLNKKFDSFHAHDAQEGINILSAENINLVLCDLHMPGLSGFEFLQALKKDGSKNNIPVLILTNLPTPEKKEQAQQFGAADIFDKTELIDDREKLLNAIHLKLLTDIQASDVNESLVEKKNKFIANLIKTAIKNDFEDTAETLCEQLKQQFKIDYLSLWTASNGSMALNGSAGTVKPSNFEGGDGATKQVFQQIRKSRKPYFSNNVASEEVGIMHDFSKKHDLNAEIGLPLFSITERQLLMNNMGIPEETPIFGFVSLKRNRLFTSEEYHTLSRMITHVGTILWRLFSQK